MSTIFNSTFQGTLGTDAQVVQTKDKKSYFVSVRVCANRTKLEWEKDDQGKGTQVYKDYPEWINVTMSGQKEYLDKLATRLIKGTRVMVTSTDIPTPSYYISKTKEIIPYLVYWADKIDVVAKPEPKDETEFWAEFARLATKIGADKIKAGLEAFKNKEDDSNTYTDGEGRTFDKETGAEIVKPELVADDLPF